MNITEILSPEYVQVPLRATEKIAAITELVDLHAAQGQLHNRDVVLKAVLQREETRSTGIGQGLAVPHGKCNGCTHLTMAMGKASTPIDFGSNDGRPCKLIVLLASPIDKTGPHIQALARISRLWMTESFQTEVEAAQTAQELYDAILRHQG